MIGLPLFWDQYDNAQRLDDAHYGARLLTYEFEPEQMELALDRVLHDAVLRQHMQVISRRLQANPGTVRAAELIERVVA
jgi:UDP:flavonoid glycosyltransferase YjiC (YdhE family)